MKRPTGGATEKQWNYARRRMAPTLESRKQSAIAVGYSLSIADKPSKIEKSEGFNIATGELLAEAGNLALGAMHTLKGRGFDTMTNNELLKAISVMAQAFERFTPKEPKKTDEGMNALREILLRSKAITVDKPVEIVDNINPFDID